jgi:HSP20 family protein
MMYVFTSLKIKEVFYGYKRCNEERGNASLAAPGMKKDDFSIDVEGNLLTISAEREEKDERHTRRKFNYTTFSRSFTLPEGVVKDRIDASYENGLLKLMLPKRKRRRRPLQSTFR